MKTILIVLMVCGQPDTFIVKHPNQEPIYTHSVSSSKVAEEVIQILKGEPELIIYEDDRGICS